MKIYQLVSSLFYGDAVGNDVLTLDSALKRNGFETCIYAENIDQRIDNRLVKKISELKELEKNDLIIYHFAIATKLNLEVKNFSCRVILRYHNITPYNFFEEYSVVLKELCWQGREQLKLLKDNIDYCLAVSEFNKHDLENLGFKCKIDILPILIPFSDYEREADKTILKQYKSSEFVNILFTGRISPNKKQEDIVAAFHMYQKYYNEQSRLFLVGSYNGMEIYYNRLRDYVKKLGTNNVYFTGHIKFEEILAYYKIADVFLCMSEHEGFCVPLVEAMFFELPIIAYDSTAIGETLGGSEILMKEKNPLEIAGMINYIVEHPNVRRNMIQNGKERLINFEYSRIEAQFINYLNSYK